MSTKTRTGPYSFADFLELIHEEKADLIDGAIYMASPESIEHNDLVRWLATILGIYIEERQLGHLSVNKVAYRLTPNTAPEPDLGFVKTERIHILKSGYVDGAPDVAIEFVSPDSVERDYEKKKRAYEAAGVNEYWIIDPDEQRATFLVRSGKGFHETSTPNDIFKSNSIKGFWIDVNWFWEKPLRPTLATVQSILKTAV